MSSNHSAIRDLIKQYVFTVYNETYNNKKNKNFVERYVGKHPLLKPEPIVVNDQLHGFKKISKKVASLEEFPIYIDIEGVFDKETGYFIDSIDIYSETQLNCQDRLTDIIYFTKLFSKYITIERSIDVLSPLDEVFTIKSKVQDYLVDISIDFIQEEIESSIDLGDSVELEKNMIEIETLFIDSEKFNTLLGVHLKVFIQFIKVCHDLLIKKKTFAKVQIDVKQFMEKEDL